MLDICTSYVEASNINDAWREVMWLCVQRGYDFVVKGGSYVGQIRKQLSNVAIKILSPGQRPLAPIVPPPYPSPTSEEKIEQYFLEYIMSSEIHGNEDYTYGSYIAPQLDRAVELLKLSKGNTNQACISVGDRQAIHLTDPPCLRVISFKVVEGMLNMTVFFRSWDLFAGLPENLGGLQLLKEYVVGELQDTIPVEDGHIFAYSDGLHLYEQYFDLVNVLNVHKVQIDEKALKDKEAFANEQCL